MSDDSRPVGGTNRVTVRIPRQTDQHGPRVERPRAAESILDEVEEIRAWIEHRHTLMHEWELVKSLKPGYRSLFYGPPGTGKTLTASCSASATGPRVPRRPVAGRVEVHRRDREEPGRRLRPGRAPATGSCSSTRPTRCSASAPRSPDANDATPTSRSRTCCSGSRTSRASSSSPPTCAATSTRRSRGGSSRSSTSRCRGPSSGCGCGKATSPTSCRLAPDVDLARLADQYELSGGSIINVLRFACLKALRRASQTVRLQDITEGVRRELRKDGKVV